MKTLIDCRPLQTYSAFRGIGRYARQLIHGFNEDEWAYFLFFSEKGYWPELKRKVFIRSPRRLITFTDHLWLKNLLLKTEIELYHSTAYALPVKSRKTKYVITIHDLTPLLFPENSGFRHRFIFKKVIDSVRRADRVIAVSQNTAYDLLNLTPLPEDRVRVIHNPLDARIDPARSIKPKMPLPAQYMFYTGGDDPIKNIKTIIQTLPVLKIPLVIAGMIDAAGIRKLRAYLSAQYQKLLLFAGYVSDEELSYLYQQASVFVFPSLYEGFGYPPLEALRCGTLSVVSRRSSLPEVLGNAAVYVDNPLDSEEFSEKIRQLLENSEMKKNLLKEGRIILKKYSIENFKKKIYAVYLELMNN
ncbi:MAG: glycosyltransferase family 4 protein [Candidatus Aminicenantes bacterium]|nr:glycosyltransferase family 4 protein [Candidatus Aminicenantes bacterium]